MATITEQHFTSGGETCAATLFTPEEGPERLPAVVLVHGFTATRADGLQQFAERFAAEGWLALTFDFRGFGDSGGSERQVLSIKRELEDVAAALAFVRSHERVDRDRVAVWGTSLGAGLTLETIAGDPAVRCAIGLVPFVDGLTALWARPPALAARLSLLGAKDLLAARRGEGRVMIPAAGEPGSVAAMNSPDALPGFEAITPSGSRWENRVNAAATLEILRWRPVKKAGRVTCPFLIQVGERDIDSDPRPAALVAARAPRGELKRYDCGHFGGYTEPWFGPVIEDQVEFLKRTL